MCQRCEGYAFALSEQAKEHEAEVKSLNSALSSAWGKVRKLREEYVNVVSPPEIMPLVEQVFEHWRKRCYRTDCMLTDDRRVNISKMIHAGYEWPAFVEAIEGAAVDAFEKNGVRYDDIALICRDGKTFDSFRSRARAKKAEAETPAALVRKLRDDQGEPIKDDLLDCYLFSCPACRRGSHYGEAGYSPLRVWLDGGVAMLCTNCGGEYETVKSYMTKRGSSNGEGQGVLRDREVGQDRSPRVLPSGGPAQGSLL